MANCYFFLFSQKISFDIACKLFGKNKENICKCHPLEFLLSMQSGSMMWSCDFLVMYLKYSVDWKIVQTSWSALFVQAYLSYVQYIQTD